MINGFINNKIVLVTSALKRAGQEKVVYELANGLRERGYEVEVACFRGGPYKDELESKGVKVTLLAKTSSNNIISKIKLFTNFKKLVKTKSDYSFIYHGLGFEKLWILYCLISKKIPFSVFVFHNNYPFIKNQNLNFKKLKLKLFLRFIDKVVFIKKSMMSESLKSGVIQSNKNIKVIENGIEIPELIDSTVELKNLKSHLGFQNNDKILVQVGRFADQKNQLLSIKAIELINHKIPNLKLVLLGEGKNMQHCKNYVSNAKLNESIIFKGNVSNVIEYLNIADLFLMPSDFEGHPIALIEAMMLNLKAVVYKAPGIQDFLPMNLDCLNYIVPRNPSQMAKIIVSILLNKKSQQCEKLFLRSCKWVRQNYSQEKMVQEYINLLKVN